MLRLIRKIGASFFYGLKKDVFSLILCIYLLISFVYLFVPGENKIYIKIILVGIGFSLSVYYLIKPGKSNIYSTLLFIATLLVVTTNSLLYSKNTFIIIAILISNLGMSILLTKEKKIDMYFVILFLAISGFFIYQFIQQKNPNILFEHASRNWISVIMLTTSVVYYIVRDKNNKKLLLYPAVISLLISIWAVGRAGIICNVILLMAIFYIRIKALPFITKFIISVSGFAVMILVTLTFYNSISAYFDSVSYFDHLMDKGITDDHRANLISHYLSKLNDNRNLIFGYNYIDDPYMQIWEFNPHNSFINLHFHLGIFSLVYILLFIFALVEFFFSKQLYFFLFLVILLRSFTDAILFFGRYDFIVFFFLFYGIDKLTQNVSEKLFIKRSRRIT